MFRLIASLVSFFLLSGCAVLIRSPAFDVEPVPGQYPVRGAFHVHSDYSGDSKISLKSILRMAERADLDFVVVTDHNTLEGLEAYRTGNYPSYPLLVFGNEHSRVEGHLITFGVNEEPPAGLSTQALIDWAHQEGGYAILAHPYSSRKPWTDWSLAGFDGLEVYNFGHEVYRENKFALSAKALLLPPRSFLNAVYETPSESLSEWRGKWKETRAKIYGASDAHLHWKRFGIVPENFLMYFHAVTMYVWVDELTAEQVSRSLGEGRSFMAIEPRGVARDFSFTAQSSGKTFFPGDILSNGGEIRFSVKTPRKAQIRIYRDADLVEQAEGTELVFQTNSRGAYHVEVYRGGELWILTNPIDVR